MTKFSPSDVLRDVKTYSDVVGEALTLVERVVLAVRGLSDPKAKALRLRHAAARLYRVAVRADRLGFDRRADNLRDRAAAKWEAAQALDPVSARTAAASDLSSGTT